jgi:hypothetical protein
VVKRGHRGVQPIVIEQQRSQYANNPRLVCSPASKQFKETKSKDLAAGKHENHE